MWNPEKIRHRYLVHLPTLPVYCSHFTLGNPKKSFSAVISYTYFRLFALSRKKTNYNCCTAVCLLTVVYVIPIICVAIFHGQFFLSLWSAIFRATNANPQHALFRVTNIWRSATLPAIRCKSFTFYKVVRWHFSGVVGKRVTVCFFLNKRK